MPNLANPNNSPPPAPGEENKQPSIVATTIIVTVLADSFVGLRLIVRKWVTKSIGWDDWTIIAAALGITIGCALVVVEVYYGFGRYKTDLTKQEYADFTRYSYGEWIQTFATLMFTKVSICLFLLRIVISKAFIRSLQLLIGALILSNIILTILWIVQCRPVWLSWVNPETPGSCFTQLTLQRIILAQAIVSIVSDFILATYPVFILRKLQMALRVKIGLCILMGLGIITGVFCIIRTIGNWQNVNDDSTWNSVIKWYWRSWEVCVGIITACLPALRPGYKSVLTRIKSYSRAYSSATSTKAFRKASEPSHVKYAGALPMLPSTALRPDRGEANVVCTTATSEDEIHLPLQGYGIMRTTRVDLESQRTASSSHPDFNENDSQIALRGTGTLM